MSSADDANELGPSAAQAAATPLRSLERIDMADRSKFRRLYPSKREVLRRWSLGRTRNEAFEQQIKVSFKHADGSSNPMDISSVVHSGKRLLAHYNYLAAQLHWQEWYRRRLAAGMEPDPRDDDHSSGGHSASGERSVPHSSSDVVEETSASGASEPDSVSVQSPAISLWPESLSPPAEHTATSAASPPPPAGTTSRRSSGDHSRRRSKSEHRRTSGHGRGRRAQRARDDSREHRPRSTRRSHQRSRHHRSITTSPSVSRIRELSSRSPRSGSSSDSRRPWRPRPPHATSSPDPRPPRRSGRQDEVRARRPVEPQERRHHSTRTSGHHRTPALLRVLERLLCRIRCGEYIDFSDLLQENMYPSLAPWVAQQALQVQRTEGGGLELAMRSQTKRKVSDFSSWLEAFFRYLAAVTIHEPHRLGELLAYADIIRGFAVAYHPAQWLGYDAQFRSEATRNLDKRWDSIQSQIGATHLVTPFCAKCLQRGHTASDCVRRASGHRNQTASGRPSTSFRPGTPRAPKGKFSHTPNGQEVCLKFNSGTCHGRCRFTHICHQCLGGHPATRCLSPNLRPEPPTPAMPSPGANNAALGTALPPRPPWAQFRPLGTALPSRPPGAQFRPPGTALPPRPPWAQFSPH